ncbi:MAG: hypothetical protein ACKO2Z_11350, partial [Sphaerospermopsis kisseleviana]
VYGARPLKRSIQREVENPLATKLLENTFISGDTIFIDKGENGLTFSKKQAVKVSVGKKNVKLVEASSEV